MIARSPMLSGSFGAGILDPENPWPGLLPFVEADRAYFRGREREAEVLHRLVKRERLTVLFGKSGLGKSSLLLAGLFPRVRAQGLLPVYLRLDFSDGAPDFAPQVKTAITCQTAAAEVEAPGWRPDDGLWECFHRQNADFWNARNRVVLPLLVFDQFEEIFTLGCGDAARTQTFVAELADLVEGAPPAAVQARLDAHPEEAESFVFDRHPYKILLSLREDYLPNLEGLREQMSSIGRNRYRLRPMRGEAALAVVGQVPGLIEERVAEDVVRFVAAAREPDAPLAELEVEPALLSVVCRELNNKRQQASEPRITADLLAGSQEEILNEFYARGVEDLPVEVRTFVEEQLLTVSGYRDSVAMENVLSVPGVTPEAIDDLVARRLVRADDRGGVTRLELTHDLLTGVITASRDRRRQREAEERERQARRQAEERERRVRKQLRRSRRLAALFLVLLAVAIGAGAWAFKAQRQAERALDRVVQTLRDQLEVDDSRTVLDAMDRLVNLHGQELTDVLAGVPDRWHESNRAFVELDLALVRAAREPGHRHWAPAAHDEIRARFSRAKPTPPTWEQDARLNPRMRIPAGGFLMGSPGSEGDDDERPQHRVQVSTFYLQAREVTNREYWRFDPRHDRDAPEQLPVVRVMWFDAVAYAIWLGGRLPTEAEWEYASRADTTSRYWSGDSEEDLARVAWYQANSGRRLHRVAEKQRPNPWGLHDMHGNAWEWVADWYGPYSARDEQDPRGPLSGERRVFRGGSFWNPASNLRAANRSQDHPGVQWSGVGFRVAFPPP